MPKRETHVPVALILGLGLPELILSVGISIDSSVFSRLLYSLFSSIGAYLPDRIDSKGKLRENHRRFFHSFSFLAILMLSAPPSLGFNIFLFSGIIGYISHLLLDLTTPKRLPLI